MTRRPRSPTRTDTRCPYTTLFRSARLRQPAQRLLESAGLPRPMPRIPPSMPALPVTAPARVRRADLSDLDDLVTLEQSAFDGDRLSRAQYRRHLDTIGRAHV